MRIQQFYNIADSLVAGKLIGENALAAVGTVLSMVFYRTSIYRQKKKRRCNFFDMGESPSFHDETK